MLEAVECRFGVLVKFSFVEKLLMIQLSQNFLLKPTETSAAQTDRVVNFPSRNTKINTLHVTIDASNRSM